MKVLLTGATGFIGSALVPLLVDNSHHVRVLVRNEEMARQQKWTRHVEIFQGDLGEGASLRACCEDREAIIHCAGLAHATGIGPKAHEMSHVRGTENLLEAAKQCGAGRFLYLSSSKAASRKPTPYARAKLAAESLVNQAQMRGGIETCVLRPAAVYGPGMKGNLAAWIRRIQQGRAPPLPPLKTRIAMIGREDLCRAITLVLGRERPWGNTFMLYDGIAYPVKEIEARIRQALGLPPSRWHLPRAAYWSAAMAGEFGSRILGMNFGFGLSGYNTLFCDEFSPDSAFREAAGFEPTQNFYEALPAILAEYDR